ncbi:hypothetical protein GCM10027217_42960 [Pseudomaricurvus hydrocarbonicus]
MEARTPVRPERSVIPALNICSNPREPGCNRRGVPEIAEATPETTEATPETGPLAREIGYLESGKAW